MGGGGCEVGETERLDRVRSPRVMGEARDKKKLTNMGPAKLYLYDVQGRC